MNKAFIFDMDGVMVDSEKAWVKYDNDFLYKLLGKKLAKKIGDTIGVSVRAIYEKARTLGLEMPRGKFQSAYDKTASSVYDKATITPEIDSLVDFLIKNNFRLGLVSSSAVSWIGKVLPRISFADKLESIISLNDRLDLKPKPNPDGYIETMRNLGSSPNSTIILEDSNSGITAAKASGAFTIAFTQNLVDSYKQIEGDAKADNIEEVIGIVKRYRINL